MYSYMASLKSEFISTDSFHPNKLGQLELAKKIEEETEKALPEYDFY